MAIKQWLTARTSLVSTLTSSLLVVALIVTVAVVSNGYSATRVDLGDASVWVANSADQYVGRANTEIHQLNTVVASDGADVAVLQSGGIVLMVDQTTATLSQIDPATSVVTETVPLPPHATQAYLAGTTVVLYSQSTGELWAFSLSGLARFDAASEPTLTVEPDSVVSVDDAGATFAFSPLTKRLVSVNLLSTARAEQSVSSGLGQPTDEYSISSVGGRSILLDSTSGELEIDGRIVDLTESLGTAAFPVLQKPTSARADGILIAHTGGLLRVGLADGTITTVVNNLGGRPTAPVVVAGCEFAAWSNASLWRSCADSGGPAESLVLSELNPAAPIAFQVNQSRVVLNDLGSGASWAVQAAGELINNWQELIAASVNQQTVELNNEATPPQTQEAQQPPVAVDDSFGARPSRSSILPVLLNDYDANGDVLVIESVTAVDPTVGRIDVISSGQQLQLTLAASATGSLSFSYTINDGRGGTATADVAVQVRTAQENSAPRQVRVTHATVASGGSVSVSVLGDWVDPDGDPFYLASATVAEPEALTFNLNGTIVFADSGVGAGVGVGAAAGAGVGEKTVSLVASDGAAEGAGSLQMTVREVGSVPIVAEAFVVLSYAGVEVTVKPLDHVRGGNGTVRLSSVPDRDGVRIVPSYATGSFRFSSDQVGTHYLDYVVTDGDQTVVGAIRIDVASPPETNTVPITIPKTVYVQLLRNERVDVAGTDIDPAGGVLLVTGVMNLPTNSPVRAEILEQRFVRVSLEAPLDNRSLVFTYRISNGLAEAEGTITVIEVDAPPRMQPPVAVDDTVTVRAGAVINIPVLANDRHPDGEQLTLLPVLGEQLPEGSGLLFVSGDKLRYLAPTTTGNFSAAYDVAGPDGQVARAQVRIAVREADRLSNSAPVPLTVTARVLAGQSVHIAIPLDGIDPDGDVVQLLGQASSPGKGVVQFSDTGSIEYVAGEYSTGTDSFTYTVIDALGARATGVVRVGISARLEGARNPTAVRDDVRVRPGVSVSVQVLANDSDPDASPLTVVSVSPNDAATTAVIVGNVVRITPPTAVGTYGVLYTIDNANGGSSSNFVTVTVDPEAPLAVPIARDTVLSISDVLNQDFVDVDVLANVFFADGDPRDLGLALDSGYSGNAEVTPAKRVRVTIENASQIIPFRVTHPGSVDVFSYAFIWVPGFADALPQIDRRAPPISVISEDSVRINLNDYVISLGGGTVRLTDTSLVSATHANGGDLVVDSSTLTFTSSDKYFGPASISFEVTDGSSASDPAGRKALLVLPIMVTPRANQPPVFRGAVIDFEPGQEKVIELVRLTNYPFDDVNELAYTALAPAPAGFSYSIAGQQLTIRANESAVKGTVSALSLGVRDDVNEGTPGRIDLTVVPSTRPLASPLADSATVRRGETTQIDVLANDQATNPFAGQSLTVVNIRGIEGSELPAGVTITPSADKRTITANVATGATTADITIQYQVADATNDPDRYVWGTARISIQDRPDPVSNIRVTDFGDRQLTIAWNSAPFNNSPIGGYTVVLTRATSNDFLSSTDCSGTSCTVATAGNGEANAVRVEVTANNAIGVSRASTLAGSVWSDVVPTAPTGVSSLPRDGGLRIQWAKPGDSGAGTPITSYLITIDGSTTQVSKPAADPAGTTYSYLATGLTNGSAVAFSVSARNESVGAMASWNSSGATGYPAGAPLRGAPPTATATIEDGSSAELSWSGAFSANGREITQYYASVYTGTPPSCTVAVGDNGFLPGTPVSPPASDTTHYLGTGTSAVFTGLNANTDYSFVVFAFNGMGCTDSAVVTATPRERPGTVSAVVTGAPQKSGTNTWDFKLTALTTLSANGDADSFRYQYVRNDGSIVADPSGAVALGSFITAAGQQYGQDLSIQVKACRLYETLLCSNDWSPAFRVGVAVNNSDLRNASFVVTDDQITGTDTAEYRWDESPSGAYSSVTYSCDADSTKNVETAPSGSNVCVVTSTDVAGLIYSSLTITITVNGVSYPRTYTPDDFRQ